MYHTNIQSANARLNSSQSIVITHDVDIISVNETNMKKNNKFQVEGYKCIFRNRKNSHMGGVATCFRENDASDTLIVSKGEKEEYIVTRHGQFSPAINIINFYGQQESRQTIEEIHESWEAVLNEIVKI